MHCGESQREPGRDGLCDPGEREGFLTEIRASTEAAKRFETTRMVVLTGNRMNRCRGTAARERRRRLKRAHDIVAPHGTTMIPEVINTLAPVERSTRRPTTQLLPESHQGGCDCARWAARSLKIRSTSITQIMEGN
jgi:hypothetical protein